MLDGVGVEGIGFTVTTTVLEFVQLVAVIVSTKVYVVVTVGLTLGLLDVEVNPEGDEVHAYVFPLTALAPMVVEVPLQIDLAEPALALGNGLTVTVTVFDLLQPVAVIVSTKVYVVVTVGLTFGLLEVEVNPEGDDVHEYVLPLTEEAPIVDEDPVHIVLAEPVLALGNGLTVTTHESDLLQLVEPTVSVK